MRVSSISHMINHDRPTISRSRTRFDHSHAQNPRKVWKTERLIVFQLPHRGSNFFDTRELQIDIFSLFCLLVLICFSLGYAVNFGNKRDDVKNCLSPTIICFIFLSRLEVVTLRYLLNASENRASKTSEGGKTDMLYVYVFRWFVWSGPALDW